MTILEFISYCVAILAYGAFFVVALSVAFAPVMMFSESVLAYNAHRSEVRNTVCAALAFVLHLACFVGMMYLFYHCMVRLSVHDVTNWIAQMLATIF